MSSWQGPEPGWWSSGGGWGSDGSGGLSPHVGWGRRQARQAHSQWGRSDEPGADHVPQVPLGNRVQVPWPYRSQDLADGWLTSWQARAAQSGAHVTMRANRNSRWRAHAADQMNLCPNVITVSGLDTRVFTPILRAMLTELQQASLPTTGPFNAVLPEDDASDTQLW